LNAQFETHQQTLDVIVPDVTTEAPSAVLREEQVEWLQSLLQSYPGFLWKGKRYEGNHQPLISKILFETVQEVFESANRPKYTKHRHAFAGLVACGRCGCAMTADVKKGRYVYYHCTGGRGRCGNTYVREEELSRLFEDVVRRVQIPGDVADWIAEALRERGVTRSGSTVLL
jgi:Recombinase zinc beta ribbon domain